MPDTFSVALVIIGLYFAYDYLKNNHHFSLLKFFVFCSLGMLCKIPALSLFSVVIIVVLIKEIPIKRKIIFLTSAFLSFIPVLFWYFYWVPYLYQQYQYPLFFPKEIVEGIKEILPLYHLALEKFYFSSLNSYIAFVCFILGLYFVIRKSDKLIKIGLAIITFVFIVFIIKTGSVFPKHNYYIIPFTPIMALIAGYFIAIIPNKYQIVLLSLICVEAIANQNHDFFIKKSEKYKLNLKLIAEKNIPKKELIIINGGQSPQQIYFTNRKGWTLNEDDVNNSFFIDSLVDLGATYLIIDNTNFSHNFKLPIIYHDKNYDVYKLKK
jgi:4-amino-4-deoxy-L-arabinose transferase-like glycosyltransferase